MVFNILQHISTIYMAMARAIYIYITCLYIRSLKLVVSGSCLFESHPYMVYPRDDPLEEAKATAFGWRGRSPYSKTPSYAPRSYSWYMATKQAGGGTQGCLNKSRTCCSSIDGASYIVCSMCLLLWKHCNSLTSCFTWSHVVRSEPWRHVRPRRSQLLPCVNNYHLLQYTETNGTFPWSTVKGFNMS